VHAQEPPRPEHRRGAQSSGDARVREQAELALSSPDGAQVRVEVASDGDKTVVRGDLGQQSEFPIPPGGANVSFSCLGSSCLAIILK
jgi:hypothetical protein